MLLLRIPARPGISTVDYAPEQRHHAVPEYSPAGESCFNIGSVVREAGDPPGGARRTAVLATDNGATELQGINHGNSWSVYFRDPDRNMDQQRSGKHNA
jgi:hypothetical protein